MAWWNPIDWIESGIGEVNRWFGWDEPGDKFGSGNSSGYVGGSAAIDGDKINNYNNTVAGKNNSNSNVDWGDIGNTAIQIGYNEYARREQNEFNAEQAEANRAYQERMSNTQYQRAVADMQKAGVNPALALGGGGGGASTPAGGQASGSSTQAFDRAGLKNALENIKLMKDNRKQIRANIVNQTALTNADVELKNAQAIKTMKEAGYTEKQIEYYITHGVFPGATIEGGAFGSHYKHPIGLKQPGQKETKEILDIIGKTITGRTYMDLRKYKNEKIKQLKDKIKKLWD